MKSKGILITVLIVLLAGAFWMVKTFKAQKFNDYPAPIIGENPVQHVAENPEGEADPKVMKLDMKTWNWISALYNDDTKIIPKHADKFTLTFKNDGTFSASTDCNGIGGKYKVETGNRITFSEMMSTLMFCTDSQETEFRNILENASSFFFTNRGELILEQKFDSGTATFR